jgi:hypothetical protein
MVTAMATLRADSRGDEVSRIVCSPATLCADQVTSDLELHRSVDDYYRPTIRNRLWDLNNVSRLGCYGKNAQQDVRIGPAEHNDAGCLDDWAPIVACERVLR